MDELSDNTCSNFVKNIKSYKYDIINNKNIADDIKGCLRLFKQIYANENCNNDIDVKSSSNTAFVKHNIPIRIINDENVTKKIYLSDYMKQTEETSFWSSVKQMLPSIISTPWSSKTHNLHTPNPNNDVSQVINNRAKKRSLPTTDAKPVKKRQYMRSRSYKQYKNAAKKRTIRKLSYISIC